MMEDVHGAPLQTRVYVLLVHLWSTARVGRRVQTGDHVRICRFTTPSWTGPAPRVWLPANVVGVGSSSGGGRDEAAPGIVGGRNAGQSEEIPTTHRQDVSLQGFAGQASLDRGEPTFKIILVADEQQAFVGVPGP